MQVIDYCCLVNATVAPKGAAVSDGVYTMGNGVQFRSLAKRSDLMHEAVRLTDDAFLLASDFAPISAESHQQIVNDTDWIHIQFRFFGGGFETVSRRHIVQTPERSCIVSRYPRNSLIEREIPNAERWKYVCLFVSPKGLMRLLDVRLAALPERSTWLAREEGAFQSRSLSLGTAMIFAASDILSCQYRGENRRIYMRGKAIELLATVIDALAVSDKYVSRASIKLSSVDRQRMSDARTMMLENLETNLTLALLARRVGLNRTKLALGFKDAYGVSVQAFWRDAKLARARELLREGELPVTEVALRVGYCELSSFTRAFTRRFGVLPRDCKRSGLPSTLAPS